MKPSIHTKSAVGLILLGLFFVPFAARAEISSAGIFDDVHLAYASVASAWAAVIKAHATRLFWTLALISMVWTFGLMALRTADAGEFFAEFIRFTLFTGFFWWLLDNGATMAAAIISSLRSIGADAAAAASAAAGHPAGPAIASPSGIVDIGFDIFGKVADKATVWSPFTSAVGIAISLIILLVLTLVAVNMLLLLISGWILAYAGIFFLGFGGSRWTSDMAIAYFKTVLGMGAQILVMVLLVGIGRTFIDTFYSRMSTGLTLHELASVMVVAVILLVLINKLPGLFAGLVTGGGTGALGTGASAGTAMAAAAMGAAAVSTAGAALAGAVANVAGGAQAIMAAFAKGNAAESESSGMSQDFMSGQSNSTTQSSSTGESSFAQAMGNDPPSPSSSTSNDSTNQSSQQSSNAESTGGGSTGYGGGGGGGGGGGSVGKAGTTPSASGKAATRGAGVKAMRIAAGAASSLVGGAVQVAKNSITDRVSKTIGGKIAAAIRESGGDKENSGTNTLSAGKNGDFDPKAEVSAFRDKKDSNESDPPES